MGSDDQHDILTVYKLQSGIPSFPKVKKDCSPIVASQSVALPGKLHNMVLTVSDYLILSLNSGKFFVFEFRFAFGRSNLLKRVQLDFDISDLISNKKQTVSVVDSKINDSGMLTVVLSNSRAYQFDPANKCWSSLMGGN